MEMVNLYGCMIIFGIGCSIGAIFILCVLDETSGLCLDDIGLNIEMDNNASVNLDQRPLIDTNKHRMNYFTFNKHRNVESF